VTLVSILAVAFFRP